MTNINSSRKLDRRDEMILIIIAFATPLAILPTFFGA